MPDFDPQQHIETQRTDWNRVAPAWEKWDAWLDAGLAPCNHHLVDRARIEPGHHVLDLGSGTGYPAISAAQRVGKAGSVIGLDLAESMLDVARRKAAALNLSHVTFQTADVTTLPFDAARFDAVTSRFCLMFLPHLDSTLREIHRVLKPGGCVAAAVWAAPEKNPYLTLPMGIMKEYCEMPPPDPAIPGIFHLAKPGNLLDRMRAAGFTDLIEEEFPVEGRLFATGREYVDCLKEMAAPLQALFARLPEEKRGEAEEKMAQTAESYRDGKEIRIPGVALIVTGTR
ncbi:MAG: methyltransferase domain-containing protein [Nitrospirae bacterium]|nr:methyltransferase domain-containing protein [Nitrospirota bacterium]